jgi:Domain of unknown function (DUF4190)/Domain of unknown function (DUF1707)
MATFVVVTPDLRASDADRDATAERLRVAATEGRLDADELEERLSAAYGARWTSELERLTLDVTPPAPAAPPASLSFVRPAVRTNGFAIASLVLGILWMWWLGSALAIAFGHIALKQIGRSGGTQRGRGIAIAGLALGYFGALTLILALAVAAG